MIKNLLFQMLGVFTDVGFRTSSGVLFCFVSFLKACAAVILAHD